MVKFFDLDNKELEQAYLEEGYIGDVQIEISRMLSEKEVSRSELARRLKVSPAYVTQILGDEGSNLTARTIARIFLALGEEAAICAKAELQRLREANSAMAKLQQPNERSLGGIPLSEATRWREASEQTSLSEKLAQNDNHGWLSNYQKKRA